ncbi:IS110 family transposase [Mycobacterium heckeshornense]|uniref:IS110 family transposase n=2 Tax=Mycobacterium heckeshornense TaxID=110505 RepID=A0A7R7U041_9MYCO|nr:IS110 family transposase [Mycobacterium heckeshornense]MCV7033205.1 IS110 family transposase [Mycobacterium heckeshornense]BCO34655.1 IS110 family transposase [Mycobacterium heckeshornense]BCO35191.1 IS110 family transposase [Mycobacterium heckeshornense]BCO35357.1 IS110 family transposase [Mycobacterium heckeshornense]BCO36249.1 IS110 family transposase [Mycobacterium heckeshornense]
MGQQLWAGVDAGKSDHYCVVIDAEGQRLLAQRVANDETALLELISTVSTVVDGAEITWAIDLNGGGAAVLIALLVGAGQRLLYIPGRTVYHASGGYRGDGKTDAKDAAIIADQARMRRDLQPLRPGDEIAVELRILTSRRADLVADRTRAINRLRAQLLEYFPALERAFDYSTSKAALILLTGYQTPDGLRRAGAAELAAWLRKRKARNADAVASKALAAANAQHTIVPGQHLAATVVARLAKEVMALDIEIDDTETMIEERFRRHRHAEIILSMPGFGVVLGAEFLAATGGDICGFDSVDRLAGVSGLAPVPRDSGRISGNLKRPRRYHRRLLRACYLSAQIAIRTDAASRTYYDRKRSEGKTHTQAVLALARRRLNVVWAMLRDGTAYQPAPTAAAA